MRLLIGVLFSLMLDQPVLAHAGVDHSNSCFLNIGETRLRISGYSFQPELEGKASAPAHAPYLRPVGKASAPAHASYLRPVGKASAPAHASYLRPVGKASAPAHASYLRSVGKASAPAHASYLVPDR